MANRRHRRQIRRRQEKLDAVATSRQLVPQQSAGEGQKPAPRLVPVGFTKEMDQYMAAADLLVGKAGGLTTSEALARPSHGSH